MPDISLVGLCSLHLTHRFLDRSASITDSTHVADPLFLHIPQDQGPTLSIDLHGRQGGPEVPALHIHPIQRGFSALAAVLFVQSQGARRRSLVLVYPPLGTLPCFFENHSDLPQTSLHPMPASQTGLHTSIPGVRFDHHGQDQWGNRDSRRHGHDPLSQRLFQCLASGCRLTVHRPDERPDEHGSVD
jgi:hypothetical protein